MKICLCSYSYPVIAVQVGRWWVPWPSAGPGGVLPMEGWGRPNCIIGPPPPPWGLRPSAQRTETKETPKNQDLTGN